MRVCVRVRVCVTDFTKATNSFIDLVAAIEPLNGIHRCVDVCVRL